MKICLVIALLTLMMTAVGSTVYAANPVVVMETSMGKIKIELFEDKAPITVKNFLAYVEKKQYDGLVFHRVIADFMIQGGGFDKDQMEKKVDPPIKNEAANGVKNDAAPLQWQERMPRQCHFPILHQRERQ